MLLKELFESETKHVTFCFGRMNPPTVGHKQVLDTMKAEGGDMRIFVSQSQDPKKNPLDYETKVKFIKAMFPEYSGSIVKDSGLNTVVKVASYLYEQGYNAATFVAGSDRLEEMKKVLQAYNGVEGKAHGFYKFEILDFVSSGDREDGAEGVAGVSASGARAAAANNDFKAFEEATGAGELAKPLYDAVRKGMRIKESVSMIARKLSEFAPAGGDGGNNYGGDLHDILMDTIQQRYPKIIKQFGLDTVDSTVSNMVVMGTFDDIDPDNEDDLEDAVAEIYGVLEDEMGESINEIDRRGFLKGLGAAALAGAGMSAGSAKAEGPLPVMATIKFKLPNGEIKTIKKDLGNSYDYRLDDAKKDLENLLDRKGIKNYTIHLDRYNSDSKTDRDTTMKTDYVDRSPAVGRGSKDDYMDKGPYTAKHSSASYMDRSKEKEFRDMGNY